MDFLRTLGILLIFLRSTSIHAQDASINTCLNEVNLLLEYSPKDKTHRSIRKNGCQVTLANYGGRGEKWEIDLCRNLVSIKHFQPMDISIPDTNFASSADCPAPLFGIDSFSENNENFTTRKKEVFASLQLAYERYTKEDNIVKIGGQLQCVEKLLTHYLNECNTDLFYAKPLSRAQ